MGPLPLSLRSCLLIVGGVSLEGSHPSWDPSAYLFRDEEDAVYADALCTPPVGWFCRSFDSWEHRIEHGDKVPIRPFGFEFAGDEVSKANYAGAAQIIDLPDPSADPLITGVPGRLGEWSRVVEYLRLAFARGGFPGFEYHGLATPPLVQQLRDQMIPI